MSEESYRRGLAGGTPARSAWFNVILADIRGPRSERAQAGVVVEEVLFAEVVKGSQELAPMVGGDFGDG